MLGTALATTEEVKYIQAPNRIGSPTAKLYSADKSMMAGAWNNQLSMHTVAETKL
ncbi:hypothetical protein NUITMVS3_37520 [Shewanella xiamenensis]|nr:hypothetical protein NUITMVS2_42750 [Shewanella xiamenensis]GLD79318.1 hypothetical protein NUITMVS3_37520 [Shewanella xiamenensis]